MEDCEAPVLVSHSLLPVLEQAKTCRKGRNGNSQTAREIRSVTTILHDDDDNQVKVGVGYATVAQNLVTQKPALVF